MVWKGRFTVLPATEQETFVDDESIKLLAKEIVLLLIKDGVFPPERMMYDPAALLDDVDVTPDAAE